MNPPRLLQLLSTLVALALLAACSAEPAPPATEPAAAATATPAPSPVPPTPTPIPQPDPVTIVQEFFDAINNKDMDKALTLMDEKISWRGTLYLNGRSAIQNYLQGTMDSDLIFELSNIRATRNRVTYTWTATQQGAYRSTGEDTIVVVDGKIVSAETYSYMANDSRPDIVETQYTASDSAFGGPDEIAGGWVRLTLTNEGPGLHQLQVIKLVEDRTAEALKSELLAAPNGFPAWAVPYGGPNATEAGMTSSATLFLESGQYVLVDLLSDSDGKLNIEKGLFLPLTVTELPRINAMEPMADVNISLADFTFAAPAEIPAGELVIRIDNDGSQVQSAYLVKLSDGITAEEFLSSSGALPGLFVGGLSSLMPGDNQYIQTTLETGQYALICNQPASAGEPAPGEICPALEFSVK